MSRLVFRWFLAPGAGERRTPPRRCLGEALRRPFPRPWSWSVCASLGRSALDAAGERVTDLVGFRPRGKATMIRVAGGCARPGRARAGPALADDQVAFPVTRDFPIRNVRAFIDQSYPNDGWFAPACWGFLRIHWREGANAEFESVFWGGRDPRVDRLVANRAVSVWESVMEGSVPHASMLQVPADLAGSALEPNQQSHGREEPQYNPTGA